jgi:hypothetical protein
MVCRSLARALPADGYHQARGYTFESADGTPCDFETYVAEVANILSTDDLPPICKRDGEPTWLINGGCECVEYLEYMGKSVDFIKYSDPPESATHILYGISRWDTADYTVPAQLFYYELPTLADSMEVVRVARNKLREAVR